MALAIVIGDGKEGSIDRMAGRILLLLIGGLFTLIALGVGGALLVRGVAPAHAVTYPPLPPPKVIGAYAALPPMEFSLADRVRTRLLTLRVVLELDPGVDVKAVEAHAPRIESALTNHMLDVSPAQLEGAAGTRMVKDALTVAVNRELKPMRVREVLVQEMVLR